MDAWLGGRVRFSRREFLVGALASFGAATLHSQNAEKVARVGPGSVGAVSPKPARSDPVEHQFVLNPRTGTIHHVGCCARHLPKQLTPIADARQINPFRVHRSQRINVFEAMATECLEAQDLAGAIAALHQAVHLTPERVHLYDRLARLYGRQKQYSQIAGLFEDGLTRLRAELPQRADQRRWRKALQDLQARSDKIKKRYPYMA